MVATRHSLPTSASFTTTTTSSSEPSAAERVRSGTYSKRQLALLKQLNIDAKDAILDGSRSAGGGREDGEEKQVYHYRGSVYEVVGNEPVEWLQQQPERWRRKRGAETVGRDEGVQRRGSGIGSGTRSGKRKREFKDEPVMKDEEGDDRKVWKSPRKSAVNSAKRRRVSGDGYERHQEVEEADTIPVSMSRRKKHPPQKESVRTDIFIPANNPAPFSIAEIKENRAQMAVNEVLQLAAINSRIHTLAQQHKKMRKELEVLRHERETHSTLESEPSKSLEIPDSEGSFTDPVPPRTSTSTTNTTSSSAEEPSISRHENTTNTTTTTRSLSTSSSSTTSSYATATSPTDPAPSLHPPNFANPNTTSPKANVPRPTSTTTSSPPTRPPHPPPAPPLTSTIRPHPIQPDKKQHHQQQPKPKTWSFLTDLQRGVESDDYDRAETGVFAVMKQRARVRRERERERVGRVGREVEVLRGWGEV